jgi:hypothetical protein
MLNPKILSGLRREISHRERALLRQRQSIGMQHRFLKQQVKRYLTSPAMLLSSFLAGASVEFLRSDRSLIGLGLRGLTSPLVRWSVNAIATPALLSVVRPSRRAGPDES